MAILYYKEIMDFNSNSEVWACGGCCRIRIDGGSSCSGKYTFGMPNLLVLVNEIVTGKLGSTDFAWEKLHINVFDWVGRNMWRATACSRNWLLYLEVLFCITTTSCSRSRRSFSRKIHCEWIQVASLVLLVAVMRLEDVVAKYAFVSRSACSLPLLRHDIKL